MEETDSSAVLISLIPTVLGTALRSLSCVAGAFRAGTYNHQIHKLNTNARGETNSYRQSKKYVNNTHGNEEIEKASAFLSPNLTKFLDF